MDLEDFIGALKTPLLLLVSLGGIVAAIDLIIDSDLTFYITFPIHVALVFFTGARAVRRFGMESIMAGAIGGIVSAVSAMANALVYWGLFPFVTPGWTGDVPFLMATMIMDMAISGIAFGILGLIIGFAGGVIGKRPSKG